MAEYKGLLGLKVMLFFTIDHERVDSIAHSLSQLGYKAFVKLDTMEPEYQILSMIYELYNDERVVLVLGIAAALIDYRLKGDAYEFWNTLGSIVSEHLARSEQLDLGSIHDIMFEFVERDVCSRLRGQKKYRLKKFFTRYADRLWNRDYMFLSEKPEKIWYVLAKAMDQKLFDKTIVFAMKVLDLVSLITKGRYADFKNVKYIPINYHVVRMSLYSGILKPVKRDSLDLSKEIEYVLRDNNAKYLISEAWYQVAIKTSNMLGERISTLRIDSLLWQLSKRIRRGMSKREAINALTDYLTSKARVEYDVAYNVALELLHSYQL